MAIAVTPSARWRMRPRTRKGWLVAHIVAVGAWLGLDVMLGLLVFTPLLVADTGLAALCYQVLPMLTWPILIGGLAALVTGVVLGLGTHHGLVRHWWVLVKLAVNLLLTGLVLLLLQPALAAAAQVGRQLAAGGPADRAVLDGLVFPPLVSGVFLVFAITLSVFKPWGRVGHYGRRGRTAAGAAHR